MAAYSSTSRYRGPALLSVQTGSPGGLNFLGKAAAQSPRPRQWLALEPVVRGRLLPGTRSPMVGSAWSRFCACRFRVRLDGGVVSVGAIGVPARADGRLRAAIRRQNTP